MARSIKAVALLALAVAVPATAQTFGFSLGSAPMACLSIGGAGYRIAPNLSGADLTVRIDPAPEAADIRVRIAEAPDEADFVFVDDGDAPPACHGTRARTVRIDPAAAVADLVVGLAGPDGRADYRVYVRSRWLSAEAVAALFAAAHAPGKLASRMANRSN